MVVGEGLVARLDRGTRIVGLRAVGLGLREWDELPVGLAAVAGLPSPAQRPARVGGQRHGHIGQPYTGDVVADRKSTRLNSSHPSISYAVFCLKKKKKQIIHLIMLKKKKKSKKL